MARTAAVVGGNRIPFARSDGPYAEASNQDMLTAALDGLVARLSLQGERLGEVAAVPRKPEPRPGRSIGEHTALTARQWGITREEQDEIAAQSHQNLAAAYDSGFLSDLVTPYLGLERDQVLRPDSTREKLSKLK